MLTVVCGKCVKHCRGEGEEDHFVNEPLPVVAVLINVRVVDKNVTWPLDGLQNWTISTTNCEAYRNERRA